MAIEITLNVSTDRLKVQKGYIDTDINNMRNDIMQLTNKINDTSGYWNGEAGNKQRADYTDKLGKITSMLDRLGTYPDRIMTMAGIYDAGEEMAETISSMLSPDAQLFG
ncbi:hypothetical protein [Butyrivibrio sp. YAB3001]|uniref:hypothetical protein n=1 Tax=Butyrivibrio sp. YAB3001 TaxID=1520812 RepID=UPI0008F627C7|nr:hypothetical protein [Butyrivibrio sp. YAB3001]SFB82434.1 hypothetical protein SAMN02910398_00758 [Butyrivibrio sp. YAB3001]